VPFAYYERLSRAEQAVYRASDAVTSVRLDGAAELAPVVDAIRTGLERDDRAALQRAAGRLTGAICAALGVRPPRVEVLEVRPSFTGGELHGLYTLDVRGRAYIQVWMRTARHARVVAFRTFLRTLLHEIGHHLDFRVLGLPASFHTEGFFKRESSLFHQLVPEARNDAGRKPRALPRRGPEPARRGRSRS
jgi:hypothetical protein